MPEIAFRMLRVEYKENPIGMDEAAPRFSYALTGCVRQSARRLEVRCAADCGIVWDSGWIGQSTSTQIAYRGEKLHRFTRYSWRVKIRDEHGRESAWSPPGSFFETGFIDGPWRGKWIGLRTGVGFRLPVQRFLRDFNLRGKRIARARLYMTALGLYEAFLNGVRVSEDCFTPGWTDYRKRVQYQAYDVSELLRKNDNTLAVHLGEGWYNGRIARHWRNNNPTYGEHNLLKCELHIDFTDGTRRIIVSDKEFIGITTDGAIRASDIYDGELYDAWRDRSWMLPGGLRSPAAACREFEHPVKVVWQSGEAVRRVAEVKPVKIIRRPSGVHLVDFGQNLTGRERLRLKNTVQGTAIVIRHGEMLNPNGSLYVENLRTALATTVYTCGEHAEEIYEPTFTFFGFRYLEISGWPGRLTKNRISAQVLCSDLKKTGDFSCSDPMVNRLYRNIVWGQRGNFLDIPTDCPQRDERFGWTGDAQIFADAATYNMDCAAFYTKWIHDLNSCQQPDGVYPHIAPSPFDGYSGCPGWGDAAVICPWIMFAKYADTRLLETFFPNMADWIDHQAKSRTDSMFTADAGYGDWLNIDDPTPGNYIAAAYLAGMCRLMSKIGALTGKQVEAKRMAALADDATGAFRSEFVTPAGTLKIKSQTGMLLALHFDLLPDAAVPQTVAELVRNIREKRGTHLSTGFLGTPLLLPVLSRFGEIDTAYELLLQTTYPGWLYPVTRGATTMWERWDSCTQENGFGNVEMNSFNHYAYGAVGEWFFKTVCGIVPCVESEKLAGFKRFILAPEPGKCLDHAEATYHSFYGIIKSAWKRGDGRFTWKFTVPCNTTAEIRLPLPVIVRGGKRLKRDARGTLYAEPGQYALWLRYE